MTKRKNAPSSRYRRKTLKAKTDNQSKYIEDMENSSVTFCSGPAGFRKNQCLCWISLSIFACWKNRKDNNY